MQLNVDLTELQHAASLMHTSFINDDNKIQVGDYVLLEGELIEYFEDEMWKITQVSYALYQNIVQRNYQCCFKKLLGKNIRCFA